MDSTETRTAPSRDRSAEGTPPGGSGPETVPWWRRTRDAEAYAEAKRRLEWPMLGLAVVFTAALVVGEVGDVSGAARAGLAAVNAVVWLAFAAEYVWLLRLAPDRARHVRTHVLDLVIILVPVLRPLRALRVLRLLRLVSAAARSWQSVIAVLRHRGLAGILGIVAGLLLLAGLVVYALEPASFPSVGDAIWWVLVTSTTVGYGDYAPVGAGARTVAVAVMVLGVGLVGVITANIVDYLVAQSGGGAQDGGSASDHDGREAATGHPGEVGASGDCPACAETAERLARIEARLEELAATSPRADRG